MAVMIRMPDFGTAVSEVRLLRWLIEEGATVRRGDVLAEVETDKANVDLESIADGVLLRILMPAGALATSAQPLAWIGAAGEPIESEVAAAPTPHLTASPEAITGPALPPARRVAPMVANLAAKLGVDLSAIQGSGAGGVITREDVVRAGHNKPAAASPPLRVQAAVACAVERSAAEIPHLRVAASIEMTAVAAAKTGGAFYDAVFLKAMALACREAPLTAEAGADAIALAIDVNGQLYLPVIRHTAAQPLEAIQTAIEAASARCASGALKPADIGGASLALSNLGMYPVDWFEAIVFPGHAAILALARVEDRAVVCAGKLEIRKMTTVVLAADHRVINGRMAARFLAALKQAVESGQVLAA
jgi:pyruvate dehydrogenase E2 component (dihydrolipoamide acetyltransferase)